MASSLSSVPPVCPSPRPAACGTAPPHAITTGTSGMVILSPTPPVECLSTNASGLPRRVGATQIAEVHPLARTHHRGRPARDLASRHPPQEDRHQQRRHLLVGHPPVGVPVDHPVDGRIRKHTPVALGPDDGWRVECGLSHGDFGSPRVRSSGPNASGRRSPSGRGPAGWSMSICGPPCSNSTCLHRPHGINGSPSAATHDRAISRPPPPENRAQTTEHSAQRPRPYETFSTLAPATIRPSSTSAAAPTGNPEYGAYAVPAASIALRRNVSQSMSAGTSIPPPGL